MTLQVTCIAFYLLTTGIAWIHALPVVTDVPGGPTHSQPPPIVKVLETSYNAHQSVLITSPPLPEDIHLAHTFQAETPLPKVQQEEPLKPVESIPALSHGPLRADDLQYATESADVRKSTRVPIISSSRIPTPHRVQETLLEELMNYATHNLTGTDSGYKLGYSVDDGRFKRFRYEEKTPEGLIVGELGFHRDNGVVRGVRYTADASVHPKLLYEALVKFLSL